VSQLLGILAAAALASCGGGFGCGHFGVGPCGSTPPLPVAIDVAMADFDGDRRPDVVLPVSQGINDPGQAAVFLHTVAAGKTYQQPQDYSAGIDFPSRLKAAHRRRRVCRRLSTARPPITKASIRR
jgi:hypothetical protein